MADRTTSTRRRSSTSSRPRAMSTRSRTSCFASPASSKATTTCAWRSPTRACRSTGAPRSSTSCSRTARCRPRARSRRSSSPPGAARPAGDRQPVRRARRAEPRASGRRSPVGGRRSTTRRRQRIAEALEPRDAQAGRGQGRGRRVGARRDRRDDRRHRHRRHRPPPSRTAEGADVNGRTDDRRSRHRGGAAQERRRLQARRSRASRSAACSRSATASRASPGLPNAAVNELLEFEGGALGLALNLEEDNIGAVVLGKVDEVEEGQLVTATGRILSIPVGDALIGRVVNALGVPDRRPGPDLRRPTLRRLEIQAPGITGRQPVNEPLQTGIKAIDAMTPIGRGQRELIIGDRKTGKTTVAIDTILNQKGQGVKCIYVAIGQKGSTVAQTVETLREHGALEYTVVVSAPASDEAVFKYLAPYAGCAIGQHWMENGEARARRVRRPVEAGRGLPADLAAAPPPAGPRGVPRRRLLPPQPPARARREAERRAGRRLAHRAADHRDQGRRRVGVHPDQRHLDHRRPDLPRRRPVQVGRAARGRRRHLGVPRGRRRADQGDEVGVRNAEARPRAVPRARGVRHVRLRARRGVEGAARARRRGWSSC